MNEVNDIGNGSSFDKDNADYTIKPHGCICPFHIYQICSYIIFLFYAYVFYFIETVGLYIYNPWQYIIAMPYTILYIIICIFAFKVSLCDPTDSIIYEERKRIEEG